VNTVKEKIKWIDWGIAERPLPGEALSGDLALVECNSGSALLAAIDGVGHGEEAHDVARLAANILKSHHGESVTDLVKRCHKELVNTRGAVMTLASIDLDDDTMTWVGVGNVEARLFRGQPGTNNPPERILLRSGLIGLELPSAQASTLRLMPGDLLVFATDGIQAGFDEAIRTIGTPQQIAEGILSRHARQVDDALVLAVRYAGKST
jgi:negative regulator of sigma-B (phosphoserine phosphatase)